MDTGLISRLRGMRDLAPDEAELRRVVVEKIGRVLTDAGFSVVDTPIIERTDLFVRKSGGEVAGSLYTFTDPGGVGVSLRPEFTPSVIRWYVENVTQSDGPRRFQYSGPVFRYGGGKGLRFRQFHQVGGELIGERGRDGDTDIMLTAVRCIESAGVADYAIRLGHIGVIRELLKARGLSEPLRMLIISNLHEVAFHPDGVVRMLELAKSAGLIAAQDDGAASPAGVDGDGLAVEALGYSTLAATGRRTPEQIVARLASRRRQSAPRDDFIGAVEDLTLLLRAGGTIREVADRARTLMTKRGCSVQMVDDLEATANALVAAGVDEAAISVDLSFARGLDYYTGIVFEFRSCDGVSVFELGGGGRYDDLVRAFGGVDVPASGFALNVDEVALASRPISAVGEPA